jgi:uncharacterized protein YlxW (UPF0749 family)
VSPPTGPGTAAVRRDPAPSLLTSLLSDHLDPGYAAAARLPGRRRHERAWTVLGALAVGLLLGVAAVLASAAAPDAEQVRSGLLTDVQEAQRTARDLVSQRGALTDQADALRSQSLAGDARGRAVLQRLRTLQAAAGATAVTGPGLVVTVTDTRTNRSPSGTPGVQRGTVLDRDLQLVVNDLWAAGAEAVAVGGVRLEPTSTVRQAGGAMLVDDQPVPSPFVVRAVGPSGPMQTSFVVSEAYLRLSAVAQVYGIGFTVEAADTLDLPAAVTPDVRLAVPEGPP